MRVSIILAVLAAIIVGCDGPRATEPVGVDRRWYYATYVGDHAEPVTSEQEQREGVVDDHYDFGATALHPRGVTDRAVGEVHSSDTGATYWVSAQAPARQSPGQPIGGVATLKQDQFYKKLVPGASLSATISTLFAEAIDGNNDIPPSQSQCLRQHNETFAVCLQEMYGSWWFTLEVTNLATGIRFLKASGAAALVGHRAAWDYRLDVDADSTIPLWNLDSFVLEGDFDGDGGHHATASLAAPIVVPIPLDQVATLDEVKVHVEVSADVANFRQAESYISAYFRDPIEQNGVAMQLDGLEAVTAPATTPPEQPAQSPPVCDTPDPAAGTIAFADAEPVTPEAAPQRGAATVLVTRSGGSRGAVSALVTTADGTAHAGDDYQPVSIEVRFADGETGPRTVRVPIVNNAVEQPDRTVQLALSRPLGCAALGAQSTATLTIVDDDGPPTPVELFSVGGTITGLAGSGLVLRDAAAGLVAAITGASFDLGRQYPSGGSYDLRVDTQPSNPRQVCSIAHGTGTVVDRDVTGIQVTCVTPTDTAGLDPSFGSAGKVTTGHLGTALALAVQPDGKILALGPLLLARYTAAGELDPSFGTGGETPVGFGGLGDQPQAIAIQPDGKIVVAGITGPFNNQNFGIIRFTAAGQPDPSFGGGAPVVTDFRGASDRASAVLIQGDGKIVVTGDSIDPIIGGTGSDFAAARYTAAGDLDPDFGVAGKVTTNLAGTADFAFGAALQPDGKIVVVGQAAAGGGDPPDIGLVRYDSHGVPDDSFGTHGVVRAALVGVASDFGRAIALQPDGKIVVAGSGVVGPAFAYLAVRFDAAGAVDDGFASHGVASASFGSQNDAPRSIALQADGKILVAGQTPNTGMGDFGVVRFTAAGTLDAGFGTAGKLAIDFFGGFDNGQSIAVQSDGLILVGGSARNGTTTGVALARILP